MTARVVFTRPDYSYIEVYVQPDPITGNLTVSQKLDMVGFWNIFVINGALADRLFATVTDPAHPNAPTPIPTTTTPFKTDWTVVIAAFILVGAGVFAVVWSRKNRTIKISSIRLLVQILLLCMIFPGVFFDHQYLPIPAAELSPHELPIETNVIGVSMPDGLSAPFPRLLLSMRKNRNLRTLANPNLYLPVLQCWRRMGSTLHLNRHRKTCHSVWNNNFGRSSCLGRVFCGWACPFGLYLDLMTRLRKAVRIKARKFSDKFNDHFHQLGYLILALIIILSVIFASQAISWGSACARNPEGRICLELFFSAFLSSLPHEALLHLGLGRRRLNAAKLGNPNYHRRVYMK